MSPHLTQWRSWPSVSRHKGLKIADFFTVFVTSQFIGHFRCVSNKKQSFSERLPVNYTVIKQTLISPQRKTSAKMGKMIFAQNVKMAKIGAICGVLKHFLQITFHHRHLYNSKFGHFGICVFTNSVRVHILSQL